jgi:hypothetical protein
MRQDAINQIKFELHVTQHFTQFTGMVLKGADDY